MAEAICSAITSEAAQKLSSSLLSGGEDGDCESYEDKVERLEMAVLKLQTIVAVSEDFQITLGPLLHWKAKLKRVAKEGKRILRSHKKQILKNRRNNSIWEHMARAAMRFVPYFISQGAGDMRVERFERLADSASDFIRFVERRGGPTKRSVFPPLLVRSFSAGETTEISLRVRGGTAVILLQPWWLEEHDDEGDANKACIWISYDHDQAWEKSLKVIAAFHLSDSVDVLKIAMNCIDLLPSQFCAARAALKELVAEMALYGTSPPAPSPLYARFVRGIQSSHRYGFAPTRHLKSFGGRPRVPDPVLLACAHFYVMPPVEKPSRAPLELVWHRSRSYLPNKLSEQHEMVGTQQMDEEVIPKLITNGFDEEDQGALLSHERQWWCPQSSTRLSVAPLLSPPTTLLQWCAEQKQGHSTN